MLMIRHPDSYRAERAYVLDVVLGEFLGLAWRSLPEQRGDIAIALEDDREDPPRTLSLPDTLFGTPRADWLTARSLPRRPLRRFRVANEAPRGLELFDGMPILYGRERAGTKQASHTQQAGTRDIDPQARTLDIDPRAFTRDVDPQTFALDIDLFGGVFFQLTRYEEIVLGERDEHGRFPAHASLAHNEGFLRRPLANEYVELLWWALSRTFPRLRRRGRVYRQLPSHDVDWPLMSSRGASRILKAASGDLVRRRDTTLAVNRMRGLAARLSSNVDVDPYNTFEAIMQDSERHDLRSTFNFVAGKHDPRFDVLYSLSDPWIQRLLKRIHERGHKIGLHSSYRTFNDATLLKNEYEQLLHTCERLGIRQAEWGNRQHFLRFESPTTWTASERAGLTYDSSLGFSDHVGFRCGVCYEYPAFDLLAGQRLKLREQPLVMMDMAIVAASNGTANTNSFELLEELRQTCRRFNGDFTLLWHNSRLIARRDRQLYGAAMATLESGSSNASAMESSRP